MFLKWSPLKCLSLFLLIIGSLGPLRLGWTAPLPSLLVDVEKTYSKGKSFTAKFSQVQKVIALNREKKSSGVIWVKLPSKFRWETYEPDPSFLVSNGVKFWHYTPPFDASDPSDQGQLIVKRATEVQSEFARAVLSGSFSSVRGLKAKKISETATETVFRLAPSPGSAGDVEESHLRVRNLDKKVVGVVIRHKGGNETEIVLTDIELGKPIPDSVFVFQKP